jgi:hypothetical protein
MAAPKCSDEEFIRLFQTLGATRAAEHLGVTERSVYDRRRRLERVAGPIAAPAVSGRGQASGYEKRLLLEMKDGVIVVGSDAHYWPGDAPTAHRGMVKLIEELKPAAVCLNGDVVDGARASRHGRIGFSQTPTMREELEAVDARLDEIRKAAGRASLIWILGNHDMRLETYLANKADATEGLPGSRLQDHFPHWSFAWSLWVNNDVVIKHRLKGGIHATHNNTLWAGKTVVTGHLHSLKVTPFSDYNGVRWGVDTGTLNDPYGSHAEYTEENPLNHRSGFVVLTFAGGRLLWPEIAAVVDEGHIQFRGRLIRV